MEIQFVWVRDAMMLGVQFLMCVVNQAQASMQLDSTNKLSHIDNGGIILIAQFICYKEGSFLKMSCASPEQLMFCGLSPVYKIGAKYLSSRCLEGTFGTIHPVTDYHFPEELNLQQHYCENLKSH